MYILDTDTLSLVHTDHARTRRHQESVDPAEIATTLVTKVEILQARFEFLLKAAHGQQLLLAQYWLRRSEELLAQMLILPFDDAAASVFDSLRQQKKLKKIGRRDLLIASIVLPRRDTLVTRNLKHFRQIPSLQLENWADD